MQNILEKEYENTAVRLTNQQRLTDTPNDATVSMKNEEDDLRSKSNSSDNSSRRRMKSNQALLAK